MHDQLSQVFRTVHAHWPTHSVSNKAEKSWESNMYALEWRATVKITTTLVPLPILQPCQDRSEQHSIGKSSITMR